MYVSIRKMTILGLAAQRVQSFRPLSISCTQIRTRRWASKVVDAQTVDAIITATKPFYRLYYNDVYEVILPPRHRFPMEKYGQVRRLVQQWVANLSKEDQDAIHCGT
jgi:hypothetical protein